MANIGFAARDRLTGRWPIQRVGIPDPRGAEGMLGSEWRQGAPPPHSPVFDGIRGIAGSVGSSTSPGPVQDLFGAASAAAPASGFSGSPLQAFFLQAGCNPVRARDSVFIAFHLRGNVLLLE